MKGRRSFSHKAVSKWNDGGKFSPSSVSPGKMKSCRHGINSSQTVRWNFLRMGRNIEGALIISGSSPYLPIARLAVDESTALSKHRMYIRRDNFKVVGKMKCRQLRPWKKQASWLKVHLRECRHNLKGEFP
jgi:hypothetical protein